MFIVVTPPGMLKRMFIRAQNVICVEPAGKASGCVVHWVAGAGVQHIQVSEEADIVARMIQDSLSPQSGMKPFKALGAKGPIGT